MTSYTVRPAGCVAWRENIPSIELAIHWRDCARRAGLQNVLIVDDNGVVLRPCGCDADALNGEHGPRCSVVSEC